MKTIFQGQEVFDKHQFYQRYGTYSMRGATVKGGVVYHYPPRPPSPGFVDLRVRTHPSPNKAIVRITRPPTPDPKVALQPKLSMVADAQALLFLIFLLFYGGGR